MQDAPPFPRPQLRPAFRVSPGLAFGLLLAVVALPIYWLSARAFDAGRPDLFYLADAFLHGRTWLSRPLGPYDVIPYGGHYYVPFPPFPALAFIPLVAIIGPATAHAWEPLINGSLAAVDVALAWWLLGRLGVQRLTDRAWLTVLLGFSTAIWWVATRGGVWHTDHLMAVMLTLGLLGEVFGKRRPWLLGLLVGAAFLTRPPLALAVPFAAWAIAVPLADDLGVEARQKGARPASCQMAEPWQWMRWTVLALGVLPAVLFFLWYNAARFGSPLQSGYALATLLPFLEQQREIGLFSVAHLGMNLDYLFLHLPMLIPDFPWFKPDGLGLSIFLTSPGLLLALRADWRSRQTWALGLTFLAVLLPDLLYYGGGWLQYGYRYALDAIPFAFALCGMAATRHGVGWGWRTLITLGVLVNLGGVYWAYRL